jgi:hypothetical protein
MRKFNPVNNMTAQKSRAAKKSIQEIAAYSAEYQT